MSETPSGPQTLPPSAEKVLHTPSHHDGASYPSNQSPLASAAPAPAPASVSESVTEQSKKAKAESLLAEGHALFAKDQLEKAAETYSRAVELLTEEYGEMSLETVDALIAYGKCLLKNAIASSGVFGSTSKTADAEEPPVVSDAISKPAAADKKFFFGDDAEDVQEEEEGAEDPEQSQVPEEDDDDDLGTAFEVLDMARAILVKVPDADKAAKSKLAGVHSALAEVATESEKFADAAVEYTAALEILQSILPAHDRKIAEIHLMTALSYEYIPQSAADITTESGEQARLKAVDHAEQAKKILLLRQQHVIDTEKEQGRTEGAYSKEATFELQDISEVIGELDLKIEDLKQMPEMAKLTERDKAIDNAFAPSQLDPDAPVNNLTSLGLVKKKKPSPLSQSTTAESSPPAQAAVKTEDVDAADSSNKRKAETDAEVAEGDEAVNKKPKMTS